MDLNELQEIRLLAPDVYRHLVGLIKAVLKLLEAPPNRKK